MAGHTYHLKVGNFECLVIADGMGTDDTSNIAPVGATLEEWLQALHEHNIPPHQLPYSYNVLFINTGQQRVLIETGIGGSSSQLLSTLDAEVIQTRDIDVVIITHGHGDHFGGLANDDGIITFPNARCFISKREWDYWTSESTLAEMNEQGATRIRNRLIALSERIERVGDEGEIVPGFYAVPAPGHTPTHMAVLVRSEGEGLLAILFRWNILSGRIRSIGSRMSLRKPGADYSAGLRTRICC